MKFKRNGLYLKILIGYCVICLLVLIMIWIAQWKDSTMIVWFVSVPLIMLAFLELVTKGGLFYDTVYIDKHGIKIVTRKKTYDCPWEKIKKLDEIAGRGGTVGWNVITYSNEKIRIPMSPKGVIQYVKQVAPTVPLQKQWGGRF